MALKGWLMSLKCKLQAQFAVSSAARAGARALGVFFQHQEQRPEPLPGPEPSLPSWSVPDRVDTKGILHSEMGGCARSTVTQISAASAKNLLK